MKMSIPSRFYAALLAAMLLPAAGPPTAAAETDRAYVQYRQHIMLAIGANLNAISDIFRYRLPFGGDIKVHAENMAGNVTLVRAAFEKQASSPQSRAKPALWANWEEFVKLADQLQSASAALAGAAATGDMNQIGTQVKAVGSACKACHDRFRAPEEQRPRR